MKIFDYLSRVVRVAFFIATKTIIRGSIAIKLVTVFILMLTLLNLTVVGGLLNGITQDVGDNIKESLTGDVYIESPSEYDYIKNKDAIFSTLDSFDIDNYSARLTKGVVLEYEYKNANSDEKPLATETVLTGINPDAEDSTTVLPDKIIAGDFLENNDHKSIVLGSALVDGYNKSSTETSDTLGYVGIGDKVRARFPSGTIFEFTVVGIINTKASAVDQRSFVSYKTLRQLSGLSGNEYSEIAIQANNQVNASFLAEKLKDAGAHSSYNNDVKEADEAMPGAVADLQKAFSLINNMIAATAILIALVTIFVVIFINASSRRRHLGILKAQGIEPAVLILSYIFQALLYTIIGVIIGTFILLFFLQGYFERNPISLPMADGELLLSFNYVTIRVAILMASSLVSGFVPAWLIVRQNTLDSILGR